MAQFTPEQIQEIIAERDKLREEKVQLQTLLRQHNLFPNPIIPPETTPSTNPTPTKLSVDEKIALFRSLFRGRDDIYAQRWEGKNGKISYSPACINHWTKCQCAKPKIRCPR